MKISLFDAHDFEKPGFDQLAKKHELSIQYIPARLNSETAVLAKDSDIVCSFVNDKVDKDCLIKLKDLGVQMIALRCAGFNHVDRKAAEEFGITVARVPGYSPNAVSEYTLGLILNLNRKIHKSYARVREHNFSLNGLVGFDLAQKTIGVIGTGKIGSLVATALSALGCEVLCYDKTRDTELEKLANLRYVELDELFKSSKIISLHIPLTPETFHIVNTERLQQMKKGSLLINTSRGALIDSTALIQALKSEHLGGAALDVYEEEEAVFFQDVSDKVIQDDVLTRLISFPNVLISSHQAFLTEEALDNIAETTISNILNHKNKQMIPKECLV